MVNAAVFAVGPTPLGDRGAVMLLPGAVWAYARACSLLGAAWLIAMPFLAAAVGPGAANAWSMLDSLGLAVALSGLLFEATPDAQMAAFKATSAKSDMVMNRGLWRYSRHPNYFG